MNDAMIAAAQISASRTHQPHVPLWGAIAYSRQAGTFGWSSRHQSAEAADHEARSRGVTQLPGEPLRFFDPATIVARGADVFLALAIATDGTHGCGSHSRKPAAAEKQAIRNCPGQGARIVLSFGTRIRPANADSDIYAYRGTVTSPAAIRYLR